MSLAPKQPIVCYVTDRNALDAVDSLARVRETLRLALAAGADWVQIREKDFPARALAAIARDAVAAVFASAVSPDNAKRARRPRVIVNDRLDIALASGAGGVHLGRQSAPARDVIAWCRRGNAPSEFAIGVSCHSLEEVRAAETDGASYAFFGPIFETPSKREFGNAQGIAKLAEVCSEVRIPVIAIGGVNEENGAECIQAGASGIAAIRLFQEASHAGSLRAVIERLHRTELL